MSERDPHDAETLDLLASVERLLPARAPVAVDPDIAEAMGAFEEDAIDPDEAMESLFGPDELGEDADDEVE